MKLARSTYYYRSRRATTAKKALGHRIALLCAEFPRYGYRRVTAQLRAAGMVINYKAVARVMREYRVGLGSKTDGAFHPALGASCRMQMARRMRSEPGFG